MKNFRIAYSLLLGIFMIPVIGLGQYFYDLKKEMTEFNKSFEQTLNTRDNDKIHSYFFEDAQQILSEGKVLIGQEEIVSDLVNKLFSEANMVAMKINRIHATDSLITVWGSFVHIPENPKEEEELTFQNYEKNLLYTDGRWRIQKIRMIRD